MKELKQILSEIARNHFFIPTLRRRRSDSLDFHSVSVWAVKSALKAAYDAGHEAAKHDTIDIHELLAERKQIAAIWCLEDVQAVRPDLTDDQAWEVLQDVRRHHDAELGINWLTLECIADELFGDAPETDEAGEE